MGPRAPGSGRARIQNAGERAFSCVRNRAPATRRSRLARAWRIACTTGSAPPPRWRRLVAGRAGAEGTVENYMMFGVGLLVALIAFAGVLALLRDVH